MVYTKVSETMYLCRNLFVIITILLIQVTLIGCTNTSTVCYGSNPPCTIHRLSCPSPLVIQIINTSYGYRPECNDGDGQTTCINTACCKEEPGDCFILFSSQEDQQVVGNCSRLKTCEIRGLRRYNTTDTVCNGRIVSAYSKVQYDCVTNGSSINTSTQTTYSRTDTIASTDSQTNTIASTYSGPNTIASTYSGPNTIASTDSQTNTIASTYSGTDTMASTVTRKPTSTETTSTETTPQPTRTTLSFSSTFATNPTSTGQDDVDGDTDDVGSIVGGIFGAIIIIVIIIVVVVFLYKRRKKSLTPPSTDKKMTIQTVTPQYHVIDGPGTINNLKDTSGYDEIELDSKPRVSTTDNYDHVRDDRLKIKSPKEPDNYNHIGTHGLSTDEDNYNHIGNNLSPCSNHFESDYNHINGVRGTFNDEDDYNHIGDNDNKNVITDDNYHHIGSGDIKVEGDYNHIGSEELSSGSNDHYTHIHDDNNLTVDQAHIDSNNPDDSEAPYNFATC